MASQSKQVAELEKLVRAGLFDPVKRTLSALNVRKIKRDHLVQYANIANRVDQPRIAHRILHGVVRSDSRGGVSPTEVEKVEYSDALLRMGLFSEARKILSEVVPTVTP